MPLPTPKGERNSSGSENKTNLEKSGKSKITLHQRSTHTSKRGIRRREMCMYQKYTWASRKVNGGTVFLHGTGTENTLSERGIDFKFK